MKYKLLSAYVTALVFVMLLSGCGTVSYYSHIMNGHHELMEAEEDIEDILADHKYDEAIRVRLSRALEIRKFASAELALPDNDSYKTFVKLNRKYPVWNVVAAEKFSIHARQWCFLFVGCISYRGYFNEQDAEAKANELKAEGYDVTVSPAAAYSTLGWFDDPLLSSMLYKEEAHLAGIIFHELAHQKVYIDDDSSFNEAFATTVELEGVRRWLEAQGDTKGIKKYRQYKQRQREFNDLLQSTRNKLQEIYRNKKDKVTLLSRKKQIINAMKSEYKKLKKQWGGYSGYDKWMQRDINNAHLVLVATYHELVPSFEVLLRQQGRQLDLFYTEVTRLGELKKAKRSSHLVHLVKQKPVVERIN